MVRVNESPAIPIYYVKLLSIQAFSSKYNKGTLSKDEVQG
jgi:hypothetical protein